jgi:GH43 family beta-xylosidase
MSYRNPVYSRDFADPFVLKYRGAYWAYSTGFQADGRVFGILHSDDLIHWQPVGSAMDPLPGDFPCYWAPEVTYEDDGSFLMYYSVGNEENMVIRVARAEDPAGPFYDLGSALTNEPFAIDAHVFKDDDGSRYLFYATDFLRHTHIGTGTVVAKMKDPFSLEGEAVPVTRAKYDWQVYDPKRESKGGVRWHTVEGPFVLKRKGIYYEMFSGGNWQNITYGVSFATSDRILTDAEWQQHADGEKILPILRTIPDKVVGPGHNSVVRGPNNRDLYCVYHEWVNGERVLAIDRLDWCGPDMLLLGPTIETQPGPSLPEMIKVAESDDGSLSTIKKIELGTPTCLLEFSVKLGQDESIELTLEASDGALIFQQQLQAGARLLPNAWHLVRLEIDWCHLSLKVGEAILSENRILSAAASELHIRPNGAAAVSPVALTRGWEDLFDSDSTNYLALHGWQTYDPGAFTMAGRELRCNTHDRSVSLLKAFGVTGDFELVVNARLDRTAPSTSGFELVLGDPSDETIVMLLEEGGAEIGRVVRRSAIVAEERFRMPAGVFHQIRVLYSVGEAQIALDGALLSTVPCSSGQQLALRINGAATLDMVRVTEIATA